MSTRSATGFFVLAFVFTLLLTACQTTETQSIIEIPPSDTRATITGTIVDSLTEQPLDSVTVSYRGADRTLSTDASGRFTLENVAPGVYIFDLSKYGYHERRNVAALVNPRDNRVDITTTMLSQSLEMQCGVTNADYHADIEQFLENDSSGVRLRTLDFVAENRDVLVQPALSNNVNAAVFIPKNVGRYGNYELTLVKEDGTPVPFEYIDAPPQGTGQGDQEIYERGDVRVIVPRQSQRLEPTRVRLTGDVAPGMPLFAKMRYTFALDETLRPTPTSTFSTTQLDSLRAPFFDTLRVSDQLIVPDSLILGVDTTQVRVLGTDTTIIRGGQVLYSSEENDTMDVNTALSLLRLRKEDEEMGPLQLPPIDTTRPPLYLVNRFDERARDTLITDASRLSGVLEASWPQDSTNTRALRTRRRPVWRHDPPKATETDRLDSLLTDLLVPDSVRVDSLLSDSTLLSALLPEPAPMANATPDVVQIDDVEVDSVLADSAQMSPETGDADAGDSTATGPSAARTDAMNAGAATVDSVSTDSGRINTARPDTARADTARVDTAATDSVTTDRPRREPIMADSVAADSLMADTTRMDAPSEPDAPVITIDSLRKTVNVDSLRRARRTEILRATLEADTSRSIPLEMIRSAVLVDSLERAIRGDSLRTSLPPSDELLPLAHTLDSLSTLPPIPRNQLALSLPTTVDRRLDACSLPLANAAARTDDAARRLVTRLGSHEPDASALDSATEAPQPNHCAANHSLTDQRIPRRVLEGVGDPPTQKPDGSVLRYLPDSAGDGVALHNRSVMGPTPDLAHQPCIRTADEDSTHHAPRPPFGM